MNEQTWALARRWREARQIYGFDARRFAELSKLVISTRRRALERQLERREWLLERIVAA